MKKHLNIGCGKLHEKSNSEVEWINIDRAKEVNPDLCIDFTKGLPFEDNEIDFIKAMCCLGQVESNQDFLFVMNELWRVLKPGGRLWIYLPHKDYSNAWQDPFNQRRFTEHTIAGFDETNPQYRNHNSYYGFKPWKNVIVGVSPIGFLSATLVVSK
jgi:predicted SAM-dependent methyltransferase